MKCPSCGSSKTSVLEIRQRNDSAVRRRECIECAVRFTTVEHYRDSIGKHEAQRLHKIRKTQHKKNLLDKIAKKPREFAVDDIAGFDPEEADILDSFRKNIEWT